MTEINGARSASPHFDDYRLEHCSRSPDLSSQKYDDEVLWVEHPDIFFVAEAPTTQCQIGEPQNESGRGKNKYLWLVAAEEVLASLEEGTLGASMRRGRLSHTNLSGGNPAHCGGEIWFRDAQSIWLTGGSGRYTPRSIEELNAVVDAYRKSGYKVASCGWSEDIGGPCRFFRGGPNWS